jgi:hypothetical protein
MSEEHDNYADDLVSNQWSGEERPDEDEIIAPMLREIRYAMPS